MPKPILIIVVLVIFGTGLIAAFKVSQNNWKEKKSIEAVARKAKTEGKTSIRLLGPIVEYDGEGMQLDDALHEYSAVVAELVESNSYIDDVTLINTAYKFRILDALTQKNEVFCSTCPPVKDVSSRVRPAFPNEFILELSGGTVTVEGVKVSMTNTGALEFQSGKKYFFLLSFTPGGMARLAAGPSGVFRVHDDDSIESMGGSANQIPAQIATRFSNKLTKFKQAY